MPDTATTEPTNLVTVSDAGPSRKKLSITIPAGTVSEKLRESLDTLAVEAELPGFRRGKVPRTLLERKFGPGVRAEAKQQLIAQAYAKAIEDQKLKVLGDPTSETIDKVEVTEGKPLVVELEVEVMPEFDMPSLEGIEVRKPMIEVTDEMVSDEIRKVTINEGQLQPQEKPGPGDYLTGHGVMKGEDGTVFHDIQGAVVQIPPADKDGKGMILGILVEDFTRQFGKPAPGQTATIKAVGPDNHEIDKVRGAKLVITFEVERADRIIPADLKDILARFGMESEDQLREAVRSRITQRVAIEQHSAMRQQIARHLLDNVTITLPERLTAQQSVRTLERQRLELMYRGVEPQLIEERMAELRSASGEMAVNELKMFFILNRAGDDLKVRVEESEINGRIAQLAAERGTRPEALRQELIDRNQIGTLFQQVREHKTFDAIIAKAKVTEVSVDEYNKSQGKDAKPSKPKAKAEAKSDDEDKPAKPKPKSKKS